MEVFKKIGSRERFIEMYQNVNKITLNEGVIKSIDILKHKFNELIAKKINVKQSNTQTVGTETNIELVCED
jgi:hypothetical protein